MDILKKRERLKSKLLEKPKSLLCHKEILLLKKSPPTPARLKERQQLRLTCSLLNKTSIPKTPVVSDSIPAAAEVLPVRPRPTYHLDSLVIERPAPQLSDASLSLEAQAELAAKDELLEKKIELVTLASVALVASLNLNKADEAASIRELLQYLAERDPEFILKAALYARQELQVRQLTNFLLAFSAQSPHCRNFLHKYFSACIVLPSDWLEVTKLAQAYASSSARSLYLPSSLRKALCIKFGAFDEYQLAKYNRDPVKAKKKKEKKNKGAKKKTSTPAGGSSLASRVNLKKMVELLHIPDPPQYIMAILGRKYPKSEEAFLKSRLPGFWDSSRAGQRMKLSIPETWETKVSAGGNKPKVWESLIDHRKLPIMAALRNLRNLILSGISQRHHTTMCKLFTNQTVLVKSRLLPSNFLSAYDTLESLRSFAESSSPRVAGGQWWQVQLNKKIASKKRSIKAPILNEYREALETGLKLSVQFNLPRVAGWTLIILDSISLLQNTDTKVQKAAVLLALLARSACENSRLMCSSWRGWRPWNPEPADSALLSQADQLTEFITLLNAVAEYHSTRRDYPEFLEKYLHPSISRDVQWDSIIHLTATPVDLHDFLLHYRATVNPNLTYVWVDVTASKTSPRPKSKHPNDIFLSGTSEKILRFLCERGTRGQVAYVEDIDKKYKLRSMPRAATQASRSIVVREVSAQSWHTVRVFISSTFRDMRGERDLLVRYVFPELKARAAKLRINLFEVDLRWGLTEFQPQDSRSVEVCLGEVEACQLFVGLLGERYGTCPPYPASLEWLQNYPSGASLTELEMFSAALSNPSAATGRAFFYLRDPEFIRTVPEKYQEDFQTLDPEAKLRLSQLKEKILSSGLDVFDKYPCEWGGELGGLPMAVGLETLAQRVLDDLWNAIKTLSHSWTQAEEEVPSRIHMDFAARCGAELIGRQVEMAELQSYLTEMDSGVILVVGTPGSGKTSFLGHVATHLPGMVVVPYFVEAVSSTSATLEQLMGTFTAGLCQKLGLPSPNTSSSPLMEFQTILQHHLPDGVRVALVVDGLDHLTVGATLRWLPFTFPKGLYVVLSATPHTVPQELPATVACKTVDLQPLNLSQRQQLVAAHLACHGKTLQVSAWDNQLRNLACKMAARWPLYLQLACSHLLTSGLFHKLSEQVKGLPSTLPALLAFQLNQMETRHNQELASFILSVLLLSPRGCCLEADVRQLVSELFPSLNSPLLLSLLFSDLRQLLGPHQLPSGRDKLVLPPGSELARVATQRYLKSRKMQQQLHVKLAAYYVTKYRQCEGHPPAATFRSYLHHTVGSEPAAIPELFQDPNFLQGCLEAGEVASLMSACRALPGLEELHAFLSLNMDLLSQYPALLPQQVLLDLPPSSALHHACSTTSSGPLIRRIDKASEPGHPTGTCVAKLTLPFQGLCVAASPAHIAVGCQNGAVLVISQPDLQLTQTLMGHSRAVTCLSFLGGSGLLCSGSEDGSLSIWNLDCGIRVKVLEGHSQKVTCCLQDNISRSVLSGSWDGTLRIWAMDGKGSPSSSLNHNVPINVLVQHPELALAVAGTWGGGVVIWDLIKMDIAAELLGHTGSVQALALHSDTLVSASSTGEILVWSLHQRLLAAVVSWRGPPSPRICLLDSETLLSAGPSLLVRPLHGANAEATLLLNTKVEYLVLLASDVLGIFFARGILGLFTYTSAAAGRLLAKYPVALQTVAKLSLERVEQQQQGCNLIVTDRSGVTQVYDERGSRKNQPRKSHQEYQVLNQGLSLEQMKVELEKYRRSFGTAHLVQLYPGLQGQTMPPSFTEDSVAWSGVHTGNKMAIGCADGTVLLWKALAMDPVALSDLKAPVLALDFKGVWLVAGCVDGSIAVWDTEKEKLVALSPSDPVWTLLSFNLALVTAEWQEGGLAALLPRLNKLSLQEDSLHLTSPFSSRGSPWSLHGTPTLDCQLQGGMLVSIHPESQLRIFTPTSPSGRSPAAPERVCCAVTDGLVVFTGDQGGQVRVHYLVGDSKPDPIQFPYCSVVSGTFVHNSELLVCLCHCSLDRKHHYVQWLHLEGGVLSRGNAVELPLARVAGCPEHVIGVDLEGHVKIYSLALELVTSLSQPGQWSLPLSLSPFGHLIYATAEQKVVYRSPTGVTESWQPKVGCGRITTLTMLPDASVVVGDDLGKLHFTTRVYKVHSSVRALASKGTLLVSAGAEGTLKIWNLESQETLQLIGLFPTDCPADHLLMPPSFAASPHGLVDILAVLQDGRTLHLRWSAATAT